MSKYDVAKVRKKLQEKQGSRFKDPNEFRPPQAKEGETTKYRFYILPPLAKNETCSDGVASKTMELFYVQNGSHWVNNRSHQCPRVHDEEDCPICQLGFDMMGETDDKERRREIARTWLPRTQYAVNIFFPKDKVNPEEVAGKVMWMNASKQVYDTWETCIMADEEGDPDDPQAYGVFFDEDASYLFQLQIKKKQNWNDYSTSKFMANLGKRPIATKGGEAVPAVIKKILDQRHDLFTKFQPRDANALAALVQELSSGEPASDDAGFDNDETDETPKEEAPKPKPKKEAPKKEAPKEDLAALGEDVDEVAGLDESAELDETADEPAEVKSSSDDIEDPELQDLLAEIDED